MMTTQDCMSQPGVVGEGDVRVTVAVSTASVVVLSAVVAVKRLVGGHGAHTRRHGRARRVTATLTRVRAHVEVTDATVVPA